VYLLDANAIITPFHSGTLGSLQVALNHASPHDTRLWLEDWYRKGFSNQKLVTCREVLDEVKSPSNITQLIRALRPRLKILEPQSVTFAYEKDIHNFVVKNFELHQADEFLKSSDPLLIALAKTYGATLVTLERRTIPERNPKSRRIKGKVSIAFIAWTFEVRCIGLLQAFREVT